jgi:non-ribosomal peptide synthetase component F
LQQIGPKDVGFELKLEDLSQTADARDRLRELIRQEASSPFDLERGPLIRGRLIRLGPEDHGLAITMHHIVSDGWSMGVLTRELSALYRAYSRGEADPLEPLAIQYADYAAWQRRWLSGPVLAEQSAYWCEHLRGAPALLELPTDRPRSTQRDYAGATVGLELDEVLTAGLKALSQRHGLTLFMTLLAGWALVLSRLSNQEDLVIGTPVANRMRSELEGLIGFFVNTLALRVDLSGPVTVSELLERVKAASLGAQGHQDLPFEQVVELIGPERSLSHTPIFQVMFAWQNNERAEFELPGLKARGLGGGEAAAKFDLTLNLGESAGRIVGGLSYAKALFDQQTVERWGGYLHRALSEMVADAGQLAAAVPILSDEERHQLLVTWNATEADYPRDRCVHELFEAQVARDPAAVAVVYEEESLSYGELNIQANRLAHHLRSLGVGPDDRVAICVERSLEMVVGLLGILKAGGAYVPLDPSYPAERLGYMLADSAPVVILTHQPAREALERALEGLATAPQVIDLGADAPRWARRASRNLSPQTLGLKPEHLAYVIYTSGSTGAPKGVMIQHGFRHLASRASATSEPGWGEPVA